MVYVTSDYKDKIYGIERKVAAEISFEIIDVEIYDNATISVNTDAIGLSRKDQVHNKKREMTHKYATFEKDYFKLDGSFHIVPSYNDDSETGWWSDSISDESGYFSETPILTFTLNDTHSSIGLSISFDIKADECPEEFYIDFFGTTGEVIHSQHVTNNENTLYIMDTPVNNFKEVSLTIIKTRNRFRNY